MHNSQTTEDYKAVNWKLVAWLQRYAQHETDRNNKRRKNKIPVDKLVSWQAAEEIKKMTKQRDELRKCLIVCLEREGQCLGQTWRSRAKKIIKLCEDVT